MCPHHDSFDRPSLGFLTWKAPQTLRNTLQSWSSVDPSLFSERFVFCQELDPRETRCAEEYGYTVVGRRENLGIQGGFKAMAAHGSSSCLLLLENDCMLACAAESAAAQITAAVRALADNLVVAMKLERQRLPDDASWHPPSRFKRYWGLPGKDTPGHRLRRLLRPIEARSTIGWSIAATPCPEIHFPDAVTRHPDGFFQTSSRFIAWSNRGIMISKSWFLNTLLPFADAHPGRHKVNGKDDLEVPVNCPAHRRWWREQAFPVGWMTPGLTVHHRLDRTSEDEKGPYRPPIEPSR